MDPVSPTPVNQNEDNVPSDNISTPSVPPTEPVTPPDVTQTSQPSEPTPTSDMPVPTEVPSPQMPPTQEAPVAPMSSATDTTTVNSANAIPNAPDPGLADKPHKGFFGKLFGR